MSSGVAGSMDIPGMRGRLSRRRFVGAALAGVAITALSRVRAAAADEGGSIVARLRPEHPRLWVTGEEFDTVRDRIASSPVSAEWYANLRGSGERMLAAEPSEYELPDGIRLLATSRRVRNRVLALTMLYQLDGDEAYAERTWVELEAAAKFPDWNPSHFLDTAEMTHAFAIGYDWLYHFLSDERRQVIRNAIIELGLTAALPEYRDGLSWSVNTTNWNLVCNGGLGTGALAIGDEAPEIAEEILTYGLDSIPLGIGPYAPDGGYPEGIGSYWAYGTRYLVAYLASLQTAIDTDFGLSDSAGLSETGYFPIYLTGPTGQNFNYYDAGTGAPYPPEMCWLASTYDRPIFSWWARKNSGGSSRHLLWYDPEIDAAGPRAAELPFDAYFRHSEVATARSAWDDPRAVFVGFKGGDNQTSHGDLDLGTFVFDALGARWATELGSEDYNVPGYWDNGATGQRWTYYRKRAEGQNTLVVNPDSRPDQDPLAAATISRRESGPTESFAIADLSAAYRRHGVTSWQRGVSLRDHRREILVQDELRADQPVDVFWFMHTTMPIEVSADGASAILQHRDHRLVARILAPSGDARFTVADAAPLETSPDPAEQSPNPDVRKLVIRLSGVSQVRLAVLFTPLRHWQQLDEDSPEVEPLSEWRIAHRNLAELSELRVDGVPLESFSPNVFTYDLTDFKIFDDDEQLPVVEASTDETGARVIVQQAASVPGTAKVNVIKPRSPRVRYEVNVDWTVIRPFHDQWDFRDRDPAAVVLGRASETRAVLGTTAELEATDPEWVDSPVPDSSGANPTVLAMDARRVVTLADTTDIDLSAGFTFEAWIYQRSRTRLPRVFAKSQTQLWISGQGNLHAMAWSTTGERRDVNTAVTIPLNTWVHVGVVYTATSSGERTFRIYINGAESGYTQQGSFGHDSRLNVLGSPMLLGNVETNIRGFDGLLAYARLTVPNGTEPPQWADGLFPTP